MDAVNKQKQLLVAVSGVKNSGKTTFISKLVPVLNHWGYKIAVVKHDGHDFQADVPGTDTYRFLQSGACGTAIFSDGKYMVIHERPDVSEEALIPCFPEADIILLEGFKYSSYSKIEIIREEISKKSVCDPHTLLALVTDTCISIPGVEILGMEEIERAASMIEQQLKIIRS